MRKKQLIAVFITLLALSIYLYNRYSSVSKKETYHLSIVAAHNNSVKNMVIPFVQKRFKQQYGDKAELHIEWFNFGGQNSNMKVVNQAFEKKKGQGCDQDLIWGGGERAIYQLESEGRLVSFMLKKKLEEGIPPTLAGLNMYNVLPDGRSTWATISLSSFGFIYNKEVLAQENMPVPKSFEALAHPRYFGKLSCADPTSSSVQWTLFVSIRQDYGLKKAWVIYAGIAGNTIRPLNKTSAATDSVVRAEALIAPTIAYYAMGIVEKIGKDKIGFVYPKNIIVSRDPIAIFKGAPNQEMAEFFIHCVLSLGYQQLQMLKYGTPHGPTNYTLGRTSINKNAYKTAPSSIGSAINPFDTEKVFVKLNDNLIQNQYKIWSIALQCYFVKPHTTFKKAWKIVIDNGLKPADVALLTQLPFSEQEAKEIEKKWDDPVFRTEMKVKWTNDCLERCQQIFDKYEK